MFEFLTAVKFANALLAFLELRHFFIRKAAKNLLLESLGLLLHQLHHFAKYRGFHYLHRLTVLDLPNFDIASLSIRVRRGDTLHAVKKGGLRSLARAQLRRYSCASPRHARFIV